MKRRRKPTTKSTPAPLAMNIYAAAALVGVSDQTLRRAIKAGKLRAKRMEKKILIAQVDLEQWLESLDDARTTGAR